MKSEKKYQIRSSATEHLTFIAARGDGGVKVVYADENVWLIRKMIRVYMMSKHTSSTII
jgi:hypothetical protein